MLLSFSTCDYKTLATGLGEKRRRQATLFLVRNCFPKLFMLSLTASAVSFPSLNKTWFQSPTHSPFPGYFTLGFPICHAELLLLEPRPCTGHGYTAGPGEALPPQATLTSGGRGVGLGDSRAPAAAGRAPANSTG